MDTSSGRPVVGYQTHRTVFTHSVLFEIAESALKEAESAAGTSASGDLTTPGRGALVTAWVMAAFAVEAYFNFAGETLIAHWSEIDRISVRAKLTVLAKHAGFTPDTGRSPYQALGPMWKVRDFFAHARTQTPRAIIGDGPLPKAIPYPETDWEQRCSIEETKKLILDVRAVILDLHQRLMLTDGMLGRPEVRGGEVLRPRS